jgi:NADPH-dependent 2,4-dienoyl-CoA reductase/sulfur reductase-like enzyme
MPPLPRKLLIIGGGFAGLECASRLANDDRFEITLVDRTNHHLFQPLLYQVATASLAGPDIARSIRQILAKAGNVTVLMDEISAIDATGKTATGISERATPSTTCCSPPVPAPAISATMRGRRTVSASSPWPMPRTSAAPFYPILNARNSPPTRPNAIGS